MSVTVQFANVGRGKKNWQAIFVAHSLDDPTNIDALQDAMIANVIMQRVVMSQDIDVSGAEVDGVWQGHVYAGGRVIGAWRVIESD